MICGLSVIEDNEKYTGECFTYYIHIFIIGTLQTGNSDDSSGKNG